jgi:hypothetical protein
MVLLALASTFLAACEGSQLLIQPPQEMTCDIPVTAVPPLLYMKGYSEPRFFVIDNETDWCMVWSDLFRDSPMSPPCDRTLVDFSTEVALVASVGMRGSGGYAVRFVCVQSSDVPGAIEVFVEQSAPGDGCVTSLAVTYPFAIARVARPVSAASFHLSTVWHDCG